MTEDALCAAYVLSLHNTADNARSGALTQTRAPRARLGESAGAVAAIGGIGGGVHLDSGAVVQSEVAGFTSITQEDANDSYRRTTVRTLGSAQNVMHVPHASGSVDVVRHSHTAQTELADASPVSSQTGSERLAATDATSDTVKAESAAPANPWAGTGVGANVDIIGLLAAFSPPRPSALTVTVTANKASPLAHPVRTYAMPASADASSDPDAGAGASPVAACAGAVTETEPAFGDDLLLSSGAESAAADDTGNSDGNRSTSVPAPHTVQNGHPVASDVLLRSLLSTLPDSLFVASQTSASASPAPVLAPLTPRLSAFAASTYCSYSAHAEALLQHPTLRAQVATAVAATRTYV